MRMRRILRLTAVSLPLIGGGCVSDVPEALLLAGESGTRTFFDILISDFFSDLPELLSLPPGAGEPADGGETGGNGGATATDGGGTGTDGGESGGDGGGVVGDAESGATLFTANACAGCHCEDASGGCFPGAPSLQGADFATIQERLQGEAAHPGGKFPELSEQDLADLQAFLAGDG